MRLRRHRYDNLSTDYFFRLTVAGHIVDYYPFTLDWAVGFRRWSSVLDGSPCWLLRLGPVAVGLI